MWFIWSFNSLGVFMGAFPAFVMLKTTDIFSQEWKWYGSPRWSLLLMYIYSPSTSTVFNSMKILFSHLCSCCFSSILMDSYLLFYFTTHSNRPLQETFQAWQPSAVQTQLLPWSCFALWAKEIPAGTSLSPRWASAQPWRWFIWGLKGRRRLRWPR